MQGLPCFCLHSQRRKSLNSIRSATQIPLRTLSFRRKGSGAVKSHSPIAQRALAAGNLSTPRFMGAPSPDHPYRRVPPLEMTIAAGSIHPFQRGTNGKNVSPHLSFGRKRSGAVKSRFAIVQRALAAGDLSAPHFMSAPGLDHPYRRVPSRDDHVGWSLPSEKCHRKKGGEEMIHIFLQPFLLPDIKEFFPYPQPSAYPFPAVCRRW